MKKILKQYNDLKDEIKDLKKNRKLSNLQVHHDSVTGLIQFPYEPRIFKIEAYNIQDLDRVNRLKKN